MADQDARALLLTIQANTELLRSNLSAAERAVEEFTNSTQKHLDEQDKKFELFGKGIEKLEGPLERLKSITEVAVGALLGESLIEAGKKGLEFAGNIQFVAEQVGVTTDFLQKFRFAAGQFGASTETADEGLTKFSRSVGEAANGNKQLSGLFGDLGVKVRDAGGNVRSVEAVFTDTAAAISKIPDPAQRSADVLTLMGRGAGALIPLISDGAEGFNRLAAAADQLGVVLSPELIAHSEEVNHKLAALREIVDAQMASAIAQNAGAIETFANAVVKLSGAFAKYLQSNPSEALALLGAGAGFLKGGPEGALIGAGVGFVGGHVLAQAQADDTGDVNAREQALRAAARRLRGDQLANNGSSKYSLATVVRKGESTDDLPEAQADFAKQRALYQQALTQARARQADERLGSNRPGATNDSGKDLREAQARLGELEEQRAHASGAALTAINQEITEQKRRIGFIKQGADSELANSLASKQGSVEKQGEAAAAKASRIAEEQRKAALQDDEQYLQEQLKLRRSILDGLKSSSANDAKRDQLQKDIVNAEADAEKARIADNLKKVLNDPNATGDRRATATKRAANLTDLNEDNRKQGLSNVDIARRVQNQKDAIDKAALDLQGQTELAGLDDRLALTRRERLKYELQLLDLQEQAAKAAQQAIIDSKDPKVTQAQRDEAATRISQIDAQHGRNVAIVSRQNQGPLGQYRDELRGSIGDVNDQLQTLEVESVQQLGDSFEGAAKKALHLHGVLGDIIGDLLQIVEKDAAFALLGGKFSGGLGGSSGGGFGGIGGLLGGIGKLFGRGGGSGIGSLIGGGAPSSIAGFGIDPALLNLPGLASGGSFVVGGNSGIDKNFLSINGQPTIRVGSGETVAIIPPNIPSARKIGEQRQQSMAVAVHVQSSQYFDAHVSSIADGRVNSAAPAIANAGSVKAAKDSARRRGRTLGTRG